MAYFDFITDEEFTRTLALAAMTDDELEEFIEENMEEEDYYLDEDYAENMPCDTYGMCAGSSCRNYWKCQGRN